MRDTFFQAAGRILEVTLHSPLSMQDVYTDSLKYINALMYIHPRNFFKCFVSKANKL